MSDEGGQRPDTGPEGENAARIRVDALFERFNNLTPPELAHIGLERQDRAHHRDRMEAVEAAAEASGRSVLLGEARNEARELALRRYAEGTLNPTWIALNWGASGGAAEDRASISVALSDAASAAVVQDLVAPEITDALSIDSDHVLGLASGDAFEGALSRAIEPPAPDLEDPPGRTIVVYGGALIGGVMVFEAGSALVAPLVGVAAGLVFAMIVIAQGRRDPSERPPRRRR
jgi:hypothetical protein